MVIEYRATGRDDGWMDGAPDGRQHISLSLLILAGSSSPRCIFQVGRNKMAAVIRSTSTSEERCLAAIDRRRRRHDIDRRAAIASLPV